MVVAHFLCLRLWHDINFGCISGCKWDRCAFAQFLSVLRPHEVLLDVLHCFLQYTSFGSCICFNYVPGDKGPILFQKLDIKDSYWRCVVQDGAEWNFCYVLPKLDPSEPTQLVVPTCLQMGWLESPGYFCMCSETGRDISEQLAHLPIGSLPEHTSEHLMARKWSQCLETT